VRTWLLVLASQQMLERVAGQAGELERCSPLAAEHANTSLRHR
jgi:hypothetical protein